MRPTIGVPGKAWGAGRARLSGRVGRQRPDTREERVPGRCTGRSYSAGVLFAGTAVGSGTGVTEVTGTAAATVAGVACCAVAGVAFCGVAFVAVAFAGAFL